MNVKATLMKDEIVPSKDDTQNSIKQKIITKDEIESWAEIISVIHPFI